MRDESIYICENLYANHTQRIANVYEQCNFSLSNGSINWAEIKDLVFNTYFIPLGGTVETSII